MHNIDTIAGINNLTLIPNNTSPHTVYAAQDFLQYHRSAGERWRRQAHRFPFHFMSSTLLPVVRAEIIFTTDF